MNKDLLATQLDIVKNVPPGETFDFTVEGAAVLQVFVKARGHRTDISSAERALHSKVLRLLAAWEKAAGGDGSDSGDEAPGNRNQFVLRAAIDKVSRGEFSVVTEEEIKLLQSTYEVFSKREDVGDDSNTRLNALLGSTLGILEDNRSKLTGVTENSLFDTLNPTSSNRQPTEIKNDLMADDIFSDISKTSLRFVEEVELELNVRVFEYDGETVISGDVPSDVLVRVRDGGATINGFVAGYVAAENDIVLNGNVQGGGSSRIGGRSR